MKWGDENSFKRLILLGLAGTGAALLFTAYPILRSRLTYHFQAAVPATRDPRLVGDWDARWIGNFKHQSIMSLRSDGSATTGKGKGPNRWGTSGDKFYLQHHNGHGYVTTITGYRWSGNTVLFEKDRLFLIPNEMTRLINSKQTHPRRIRSYSACEPIQNQTKSSHSGYAMAR